MLTKNQAKKIAASLVGTRKNIHTVMQGLVGRGAQDEDWETLEKVGGVFKCDECSMWLRTDEKANGHESTCQECVDERENELHDLDEADDE